MSDLPYARRFYELDVYKKARRLAKEVFEKSKSFPKDEMYSLTDQIRRASGSIGGQLAEAWGKRRFEKHFISKLTDADSEQLETQHWLIMSFDRGYLSKDETHKLGELCLEVGRMLGEMIEQSASFCQESHSSTRKNLPTGSSRTEY